LARGADEKIAVEENRRMVQHLESGGITTLLYGGNAILHHVAMGEYDALLKMLVEISAEDSLMIPSVGPFYGTMMEQAALLKNYEFPTAMVLPTRDMITSAGVAAGVRRFVDALGRPAVLYIKNDGYIDVPDVARLMSDGCLAWIKYAVVRDDPQQDPYLSELTQTVGTDRIVSGIGEQPASTHLANFGLQCFTSGCVCIAPTLSMRMLAALKQGDLAAAEEIRVLFQPLEDLRNGINPVRVLHTAVRLADLSATGPLLPLTSEITVEQAVEVGQAAKTLLESEKSAAVR
jgi:dihydrodipicolinate synthase/N-acetylneuraminate lyase